MNIKKHIPNALTSANLLCGCIAIVQAMNGHLVWAAYLVGMAAVFDFFDGFAARLLKVSSPIGKDLDSLADMVTFGVVPGIVMYQMMKYSMNHLVFIPIVKVSDFDPEIFSFKTWIPYTSFLIPVFSAIRLAKFNNDSRQSDSFIGVPTPANAIFILSMGLILFKIYMKYIDIEPCHEMYDLVEILGSIYQLPVLIGLTFIMSFLLIAELPLIALKFKHFKWKGNEVRFIFIGLCVLSLSLFQLIGIPLCILLYILISVINNLITKKNSALTN